MNNKICLVIIFNHRFQNNIPKLREYYKGRFSNVFFLIPFYIPDSEEEDVITVYENSLQFNGFISQAYSRLNEKRYTHYIFIGDDLILNTCLNEFNILNCLELSEKDAYIKYIFSIKSSTHFWSHWLMSFYAFRNRVGVNFQQELPEYQVAVEKMKKQGFENWNLSLNDVSKMTKVPFYLKLSYIKLQLRFLVQFLRYIIEFKTIKLPYPLVGAYSDFFIIPQQYFKNFVHYNGVLASMNTFVEIAIPTSLILACESIKTEKNCTMLKGVEIWENEKIEALKTKYNASVTKLFKDNPHVLYFHPIKLSTWKIE